MQLAIAGYNYQTDRVEIDSTGAAVTLPVPSSSFLVKCVGGQCYIKRSSSVADGDAYIMDDGETLNLDMKLEYNTTDGIVTIGFFKAVSATVTLHIIAGY